MKDIKLTIKGLIYQFKNNALPRTHRSVKERLKALRLCKRALAKYEPRRDTEILYANKPKT